MQPSKLLVDENLLLQEEAQMWDAYAERKFLECAIRDPVLLQSVHRDWFHHTSKHQKFYDMLVRLVSRGVVIDATGVLAEALRLDVPFSHEHMVDINATFENLPYTAEGQANAQDHIRRMKDANARVQIFKQMRRTMVACLDPKNRIEDIAGCMADTGSRCVASFMPPESDLLQAADWVLNDPMARKRWTCDRYPIFFGALGGLRPGSRTMLNARTKVGKSLLVASIVTGFASQGIPVLWLDTEMDSREQGERLLCLLAQVDDAQAPHNRPALLEAQKMLGQFGHHIRFTDASQMGFSGILQKIEQFGRDSAGGGIVILDWLQLDPTFCQGQPYQVLGQQALALKNVLKKVGLPALICNQQNRGAIGLEMKDIRSGGEAHVSGSDQITQFCTASCTIRTIPEEMQREMVMALGEVKATHFIHIDVSRFSKGRKLIPLKLIGLHLSEVQDPSVVEWIENVTGTAKAKSAQAPVSKAPWLPAKTQLKPVNN